MGRKDYSKGRMKFNPRDKRIAVVWEDTSERWDPLAGLGHGQLPFWKASLTQARALPAAQQELPALCKAVCRTAPLLPALTICCYCQGTTQLHAHLLEALSTGPAPEGNVRRVHGSTHRFLPRASMAGCEHTVQRPQEQFVGGR